MKSLLMICDILETIATDLAIIHAFLAVFLGWLLFLTFGR